jgi:large subunit ribosomal protein L32e
VEVLVEEDEEETFDEEEIFDEEDDFFDEDEWDQIHTARQKPVLDEETKANLATRAAQMKKQPKFRRQEWYRYYRLSRSGWRKPKGMQSKQRLNMKYRTPMARVGYGKISAVRGLHPSGFEDVLVNQPSDLDGLDPERQAIRVSASVGNRKRSKIHDRADDLGLRVLNRRKITRKGDIQ